MSRVPSKIRLGDNVVWADTSMDGGNSFVFSGTVLSIDDNKAFIANIGVHMIESTRAIPLSALVEFAKNNQQAVVEVSLLRRSKDMVYK